MKKWLNILLIMLSLAIVGCSESEEEEENDDTTFINDPRIPGGNLGENGTIRGVQNVEADVSEFNQVTLTWSIPSLFQTEDWQVVIYKVKSDGPSGEVTIEDPSNDIGAAVFEITRLKDTTYVDNDIGQNQGYFYWIFLNIDGGETLGDQSGLWSTSPKFFVDTPAEEATVTFPSPEKFWEQIRWDNFIADTNFVNDENGEPTIPVYNFQSMASTSSNFSTPAGRIAIGYGGSVLFFADTANNRILVYEDKALRSCEQFEDDEFQYFACRLNSLGQRAQPHNIIGQPNDSSTLTCQEHQDECLLITDENECTDNTAFCGWRNSQCQVKGDQCLTSPTDMLIDNNRLIIADSGNDRIVLHDEILFDPPGSDGEIENKKALGCDPEVIPSRIEPIKCSASKVFGKKSLFDLTDYSLEFDGISSLDNPTGIALYENDLYIADTNNHRVVKASDYNNLNSYSCSDNSWKTPLCSWKGLLGQADYNSNKTFQDFFDDNPSILQGTFSNTLTDDPELLARYFANPNKIKFYTYVNTNLRTELVNDESWSDSIRRQIINNNGNLEDIIDIPDSIKNNYQLNSENIRTKMMVSSNENFEEIAGLGTLVSMQGRILMFPEDIIKSSNPPCNMATFQTSNCLAEQVVGQESFDKIIILSGSGGGAGSYENLNFSLESIGDFDFMNDRLLVTDYLNNNVYSYDTFPNETSGGLNRSAKAENPEGRFVSEQQRSLPDLEGISGIFWDDFSKKLYISDPADSTIYQLDLENLPGDIGNL